MRSKLVNDSPRVFVLVFDTGEEVTEKITQFAADKNLLAAGISAIGAFENATLGYFDFSIKDYRQILIQEQVEVLSIIGNVVQYEDKPKVHMHVVVGKSDGTAHGGHLLNASVKPTLEVVLTELPSYLHREFNKDVGIPLIRL